ncbi:MAG: sulfurtransferase TusA family protein [Gammaproteobacteria bacterium]|nr:sulfurtransferase TusA family protein [Gammaproteobacteria bacterium]
MSRHQLDARNLLCPLPVIRTQDRVATLAPGDVLEVLCTDPGALNDIPAWCRLNGHRVLETRREGRDIVLLVEVGEEGR